MSPVASESPPVSPDAGAPRRAALRPATLRRAGGVARGRSSLVGNGAVSLSAGCFVVGDDSRSDLLGLVVVTTSRCLKCGGTDLSAAPFISGEARGRMRTFGAPCWESSSAEIRFLRPEHSRVLEPLV